MKKQKSETVTRTYSSKYIHSEAIQGFDQLVEDVHTFNKVKRTAYRMKEDKSRTGDKTAHLKLKKLFARQTKDGTASYLTDYFVNNALQEAEAAFKSRKELIEYNTSVWNGEIEQIDEKLSSLNERLRKLETMQELLASRSRELKKGVDEQTALASLAEFLKDPRTYEKLQGDGSVKVGFGKHETVYENLYLFEVQYVKPAIKRIKRSINQIEQKKTRIQNRIKEQDTSICFGSRDLFRKQSTKYTDHNEWRNAWHNARDCRMRITGRHDAKQGNFLCRYDTVSGTLSYTATDGRTVVIPNVWFPFGQEAVNKAVNARDKQTEFRDIIRHPDKHDLSKVVMPPVPEAVTWTFIIEGSSLRIECTVHEPVSRKNTDISTGIISLDKNPDQFGVVEIDENGNLLRHRSIAFDLDGKSSAETERILSEALEEVFDMCRQTHKILAVEGIQTIQKRLMYQKDKETNKMLSQFAYDKMEELILSKSQKYGIEVIHVNPAYTSQIGKVKYMRRYGLSVHESAAMVIGRRALRIKDPVPKELQKLIPKKSRTRHHWKHWSSLYKTTSKIPWRRMYKKYDHTTEIKKRADLAACFDTQL